MSSAEPFVPDPDPTADEPVVLGATGEQRDADEPQPDDIDELVARAEAADPPFRTPVPGQQGQAG